jgi:hypothetical protein
MDAPHINHPVNEYRRKNNVIRAEEGIVAFIRSRMRLVMERDGTKWGEGWFFSQPDLRALYWTCLGRCAYVCGHYWNVNVLESV